MRQTTCFAEAGGQYVPGMVKAVEQLGLRACLTQSTMDCGDGLPPNWKHTTEECIQVTFLCFYACYLLAFVNLYTVFSGGDNSLIDNIFWHDFLIQELFFFRM
jgi:hypothetical protein